jgi:peptidoglycan/xylan/chitin deacetylase (PgdA/CDA1 family)
MFKQKKQKNSRTEYHQRKLRIFRKNSLWIFTIAVLILIGGGVYATNASTHVPEEQNESDEASSFEQEEASLLKTIRDEQHNTRVSSTERIASDGNIQKLMYEPTADDSIPQLEALKTELAGIMEQAQKNCVSDEPVKLVGEITLKKVNEQVYEYQPVVTDYSWDPAKKDWNEKKQAGKYIVINQKRKQPLTLQDLFTDEANISAVRQIIQQKMLDESSDGNAIIDGVLNLPVLSLDKTTFTYYPDKITFNLPENTVGKKEMTLSYKEIASYINTDFIAADSIKGVLPITMDPNKKYISLTFDDGPNPETTPKLLDILKEKGVKATFFMLGQNVAKNQDLVKRIKAEGHEVASHSYSHPQLTNCDPEQVKEEVYATDKAIYQAIGEIPTDFRPPYGAVNKEVATIIGKPVIQWSVDSQDWKSKNTDAIIKRIDDTAYNDTIILMHDIHPETVAAVPTVIDHLREQGYTILPSKQLLGNKARPLHMYYGSQDERPIQ